MYSEFNIIFQYLSGHRKNNVFDHQHHRYFPSTISIIIMDIIIEIGQLQIIITLNI